MRYKIVLLIMLAMLTCQAQSATDKDKIADLLNKSRKAYNNSPQYKVNTSYRLYESFTSSTIVEQYDGLVIKNGNNYYSLIGTTEFVTVDGTSLKIDRQSKLMAVGKRNLEEMPDSMNDMKKFMQYFNAFELSSKDNLWVCTMTAPEITAIPYGKIVVYINKSDYSIEREVFYLLQSNEYKNKQGVKKVDYPRLEVTMSPFDTKDTDRKFKSKFSLNHYIIKSGTKNLPSKNYKDFKIID